MIINNNKLSVKDLLVFILILLIQDIFSHALPRVRHALFVTVKTIHTYLKTHTTKSYWL